MSENNGLELGESNFFSIDSASMWKFKLGSNGILPIASIMLC